MGYIGKATWDACMDCKYCGESKRCKLGVEFELFANHGDERIICLDYSKRKEVNGKQNE